MWVLTMRGRLVGGWDYKISLKMNYDALIYVFLGPDYACSENFPAITLDKYQTLQYGVNLRGSASQMFDMQALLFIVLHEGSIIMKSRMLNQTDVYVISSRPKIGQAS